MGKIAAVQGEIRVTFVDLQSQCGREQQGIRLLRGHSAFCAQLLHNIACDEIGRMIQIRAKSGEKPSIVAFYFVIHKDSSVFCQ